MTIAFRVAGFALIALSLMFSPPLQGAVCQQGNTEQKISPSLQKSLVLPGWGQLAEKRYIEGTFFLTLELCYLYEIFKHNRQGNKYYRLYKNAGTTDEAILYRTLTESSDKRRNVYILVAGGLWAVNLVDMYLIDRAHGTKKGRLSVKADVVQGTGLSVQYRFNY